MAAEENGDRGEEEDGADQIGGGRVDRNRVGPRRHGSGDEGAVLEMLKSPKRERGGKGDATNEDEGVGIGMREGGGHAVQNTG